MKDENPPKEGYDINRFPGTAGQCILNFFFFLMSNPNEKGE